jgi:hypothetical protein
MNLVHLIENYKVEHLPGSFVQLLSQAPEIFPLGVQSQEDAMRHGYLGGRQGVCVGVKNRGTDMKLYVHECGWCD